MGLRQAVLLLSLSAASFLRADTPRVRTIRNFSLKDTTGRTWSLASLADRKAVVVVFIGTDCPVNNASLPTLAQILDTYRDRGVAVVAVNSNAQDSAARVAEHARQMKLPFPVLKDE